MAGPKEPKILKQPLGHGKEPMFFLGSVQRTRACVKDRIKVTACSEIHIVSPHPQSQYNNKLDPDGCLVADHKVI